MKKTVELRPAYAWDCDECGRENFARAVVPELSPDELEELRSEHGIDPWDAGDFVTMPSRVECTYCGAVFAPKHMHDQI